MLSDEKVQDFIDDRLDQRDRTVVCLLLARDPVLARRVHELCMLDCILRGIGAPILDEPIPDNLTSLFRRAKAALDH